jgi:hypothetical protein
LSRLRSLPANFKVRLGKHKVRYNNDKQVRKENCNLK